MPLSLTASERQFQSIDQSIEKALTASDTGKRPLSDQLT